MQDDPHLRYRMVKSRGLTPAARVRHIRGRGERRACNVRGGSDLL